jgi:hypothetical protein
MSILVLSCASRRNIHLVACLHCAACSAIIARFRYLLRAHARAGRITPRAEWVGCALLKRLADDGRCDPAHATLAADAGCSERTVRRATAAMRALGMVRWQTRLVRAGWRAEQTSNAYELIPAAPLPCAGQRVRETRKREIPYRPNLGSIEAQAALARRRSVIEARLLTKWSAAATCP